MNKTPFVTKEQLTEIVMKKGFGRMPDGLSRHLHGIRVLKNILQ